MVPTFTAHRSTREAPSCYPGSIATVTPQTFTVASAPGAICRTPSQQPALQAAVHCTPAQIRQVSSRFIAYGTSAPVPVSTPSRLASRTRAIWQYWHVPSLSGLLPALPGVSRIRLPSASPSRCDGQAVQVSHLHSDTQRLVAHNSVAPALGRLLRQRQPSGHHLHRGRYPAVWSGCPRDRRADRARPYPAPVLRCRRVRSG